MLSRLTYFKHVQSFKSAYIMYPKINFMNPQIRHFADAKGLGFDPNVDYYKSLGLRSGATAAEIKKSFYASAKKYHPDTTQGASAAVKKSAEEKFKAVSVAYNVLSDKEKRARYDELRSLQGGQGGFGGGQ